MMAGGVRSPRAEFARIAFRLDEMFKSALLESV